MHACVCVCVCTYVYVCIYIYTYRLSRGNRERLKEGGQVMLQRPFLGARGDAVVRVRVR